MDDPEIENFRQFVMELGDELPNSLLNELTRSARTFKVYKARSEVQWRQLGCTDATAIDIFNYLHPTEVTTAGLAVVKEANGVDAQSHSPSKMSDTEKELAYLNKLLAAKDEVLSTKDEVLSTKDEVLSTNDEILFNQRCRLESKDSDIKRIQAERDYLKNNLDARYIIESYESNLQHDYKDKITGRTILIPRKDKWNNHFKTNPDILQKLKLCDKQIDWAVKIVVIYSNLSTNIHRRTIELGNGDYLVSISKGLPKQYYCFIKVIAKEMYGEHVEFEQV
jgi:hypothetical protein